MFCTKCGKEIPEDTKICPYCGSGVEAVFAANVEAATGYTEPLESPAQPEEATRVFNAVSYPKPTSEPVPQPMAPPVYQPEPQYQQPVQQPAPQYQQSAPQYAPQPAPAKPKSKKAGKIIALVLALIIVIGSAVGVLVFMNSRVDSGKFMNEQAKFSGYNGSGTLDISSVYDTEAMEEALGGSGSKFDEDFWEDYLAGDKKAQSYIKVKANKTEGLKNCDVIEVTVSLSLDKINSGSYKKKLTGEDTIKKEYTVSGLKDSVKINLFEAIKSVSYDETNEEIIIVPDTEFNKTYSDGVSIKYTSSYDSDSATFLLSKTDAGVDAEISIYVDDEGGKPGETAKLVVNYDGANMVEDNGIVFDPLEKEFTLSKIGYIKSSNDISSSELKSLQDLFMKDANENYSNVKIESTYLAVDGNYYTENEICVAFSYKEGSETQYGYYFSYDLKTDSSGNIMDKDKMYLYHNAGFESVSQIETYLNESFKEVYKLTIKG